MLGLTCVKHQYYREDEVIGTRPVITAVGDCLILINADVLEMFFKIDKPLDGHGQDSKDGY